MKTDTTTVAQYLPNYDRPCQNCGQTPTVDLKPVAGGEVSHLDLCGPCCFGEAACIDPENW